MSRLPIGLSRVGAVRLEVPLSDGHRHEMMWSFVAVSGILALGAFTLPCFPPTCYFAFRLMYWLFFFLSDQMVLGGSNTFESLLLHNRNLTHWLPRIGAGLGFRVNVH